MRYINGHSSNRNTFMWSYTLGLFKDSSHSKHSAMSFLWYTQFIIGITFPLPPTKLEYEKYAAAKGIDGKQMNKYYKKRFSKKDSRFGLKVFTLDDTFYAKVCSIDYLELDFISMIGTCSIFMALLMEFLKFITNGHVKDYNISFSLEFLGLTSSLFHLIRICMRRGIAKNDEAKVAIFLGFQAWMISFLLLYIMPDYLDLELKNGFDNYIKRINEGLKIFKISLKFEYEYYAGIIAVVASLITIAQTKHVVNFTYYYHIKTKTESSAYIQITKESKKFSWKKFFLHISFIMPIFIIVLYIPTISKNYIVPALISEELFYFIRMLISLSYILLKLFLCCL